MKKETRDNFPARSPLRVTGRKVDLRKRGGGDPCWSEEWEVSQ